MNCFRKQFRFRHFSLRVLTVLHTQHRCGIATWLQRAFLAPGKKWQATWTGVCTIQRWERIGLPVRRVHDGPRTPVVALIDDPYRWITRHSNEWDSKSQRCKTTHHLRRYPRRRDRKAVGIRRHAKSQKCLGGPPSRAGYRRALGPNQAQRLWHAEGVR